MRFFGIDLHHNNMVAAIIDENNKTEVIRKTFHTPGFNDFLKQLKKEMSQPLNLLNTEPPFVVILN